MLNGCTIVAGNYLPYARVLAESFLRHNPGSTFTLLVIDDEGQELETGNEPFGVMRLRDIGLSAGEIGRLAGIYDVTELATAVKPLFLRELLRNGQDHAIYLDPDIKILSAIADVAHLARTHAIVLTPHTMVPTCA